ncbi:hypothetical protein BDW22DRAFT_1381383 [Trametopsis cervina]|nr:hypothetical protein BDW22DRAFT_1381383 [Trametopsis cervina]
MSFVLLTLASSLFAVGPQVVHARFSSIKFSQVEQCGNFTVQFSGGQMPTALPLSLTVIPFNLTPISIGIADAAWNNTTLTGAAFTFLPFPADTDFIASLDDANGRSTALVSDIIRVQPSDNTTCVSSSPALPSSRYTVDKSVSQCEDFHVTYDSSVITTPPNIRGFIPRSMAFGVNESTAGSAPGDTSYTMDASRGDQVVLLLSDTSGVRESAGPLTVGGDSSSSKACLPKHGSGKNQTKMNKDEMQSAQDSATPTTHTLSKTAIIVIVLVSVGTIGCIAIAMVWFLRRERWRITKKREEDLDDDFLIVTNKRGENRRVDLEKTLSQSSQGGPTELPAPMTYVSSTPLPTVRLPKPPPLTLARVSDHRMSRSSRASRFSGYSARSSEFVKDPLYTDANLDLMEPTSARYNPNGASSLNSAGLPRISIPLSSSNLARNVETLNTPAPIYIRRSDSPTDTLSSDDIEHILDMATMYSAPPSPVPSMGRSARRDSVSTGGAVLTDRADENATLGSSSSRRRDRFLRPSPATTPTSLLTPDTARGPPQAPLPSSPLPSPVGSRFRPSVDASTLGGYR